MGTARSTFDVEAENAPVRRVLDLSEVAGRSESDVRTALGAPASRRTVSIRGTRHQAFFYRSPGGTEIEIVFAGGRAEWITLSHLSGVPFSGRALEAVGLAPASASFASGALLEWDNLDGLRELSVMPAPGGNRAETITAYVTRVP